MRKLLKNKKGVFGLNAVQSFFAIILGIALLAYVIVIIMGTLQNSSILTQGTTQQNNTYNRANDILANTSVGVSGFFSNISPVYAILAVLVIILVLVVLVRVVQTPTAGGSPSL